MATYSGSNFRQLVNVRYIQLCDESSRWENNNPIILPGELAVVSDKRKIKIGTGEHYNDTKYYAIGTEPVNIENLDSIVIDKTMLHFYPTISDDIDVVEDYLTIEGKIMLPKVAAYSVLLSKDTISRSLSTYPINTLQDWINKMDSGNLCSNYLHIGDNTKNIIYLSTITQNAKDEVEGYRKPFISLIDDITEDGVAFRFCIKDGEEHKSILTINNDGTVSDCVVDKAEVLNTPRTITISGAVTGNISFDGSKDVEIVTEVDGAAPKNIIFKNITLTPSSFDENKRFVYESDLIKDTMVPNVYFSKDTLQYAEDAGMYTYTEEGKLIIEYNDPPTNDILVETAILIPT